MEYAAEVKAYGICQVRSSLATLEILVDMKKSPGRGLHKGEIMLPTGGLSGDASTCRC